MTFEALAAAVFAALWGWAATHLIAWPFRRLRNRRTEDFEVQERARASILGAGRGPGRAL